MNFAFHHLIRFLLLSVIALKRSSKQQTQNYRYNDEGVLFFQVRIGFLRFSTWKPVKTIENFRKK